MIEAEEAIANDNATTSSHTSHSVVNLYICNMNMCRTDLISQIIYLPPPPYERQKKVESA